MINELDEILDEEFFKFSQNHRRDCSSFDDIKAEISDIEIKNNSKTKSPKFVLQSYAYVYFEKMDFSPNLWSGNYVLTTKTFFENVHKVINVKIHLHHSHVRGEILGYAHDFCNLKVRENQTSFTFIARNFFKFDMFFLLKGVRISVWNTKDINIHGNGLTHINFANFGTQVKFIDMMKYYLTSLGKLASTMDERGKKNVEKTTIQFLVNYPYFFGFFGIPCHCKLKQKF